jgi:FkbM family methyltransferase
MIQELRKNPLLITNCIKYFVATRFPSSSPKRKLIREINGVKYEFDLYARSNFIKQMYFNMYELDLIDFMKRNLKKGDIFLDIGANVGYISAIGAGLVGKSGQVHSFEPVPEYALHCTKMKKDNPEYTFFVNNCACSDEAGFSKIDVSTSNIGWNTMVPDFMEKDIIKESLNIQVCRLDDYICKKNLKNITLIKIDTEGFELKVLKGLQNYFENTKATNRPPIYCEVAPAAYPLLQLSLESLSNYMEQYSYYAFDARDSSKRIDLTKIKNTTNVLFLCKQSILMRQSSNKYSNILIMVPLQKISAKDIMK